MNKDKSMLKAHYDAMAKNYHEQYLREDLYSIGILLAGFVFSSVDATKS